jgi:hypothetical protein
MFKTAKVAAAGAAALSGLALLLAMPASGAPNPNSTNRYTFVDDDVTWAAANASAIAAGGHLVTIGSRAEQTRVFGLMTNTALNPRALGIWLGGTDSAQEGAWQWVDTGKYFYFDPDPETYSGSAARGFNRFLQGEPNDSESVEDCLAMRTDGYWNDLPCNSQTGTQDLAYVIEFD